MLTILAWSYFYYLIMLQIIKDIDLIKHTNEYDVVLVGTNTYFAMSNGFQRKIRYKYPEVKEFNMTTKYGDINKLGTIAYTGKDPIICLCYVTHGYNFRPDKNKEYLDYEAVRNCIKSVNETFQGKKVATTILGNSRFDGNGDTDKIMKIIEENHNNIDLYVYDYYQQKISEELNVEFHNTIYSEEFNKKDPKQWDELNERLIRIKYPDGTRPKKKVILIDRIRMDVKKTLNKN